jgi:hypothetical protein
MHPTKHMSVPLTPVMAWHVLAPCAVTSAAGAAGTLFHQANTATAAAAAVPPLHEAARGGALSAADLSAAAAGPAPAPAGQGAS